MLNGSTPIFSTLQCKPNLTRLCSQINLSSDELCSIDYPPIHHQDKMMLHYRKSPGSTRQFQTINLGVSKKCDIKTVQKTTHQTVICAVDPSRITEIFNFSHQLQLFFISKQTFKAQLFVFLRSMPMAYNDSTN